MDNRLLVRCRSLVGGGSGGAASWNDLKDRPFGEEVVEESIEGMEYTVDVSGGTSSGGGRIWEHNLNLPFALGQVWKCIPLRSGTTESSRTYLLEVQQADDGTLYLGDLDPVSSPSIGYHIEANTSIANNNFVANAYYFSVKTVGVSGTVTETTTKTLDSKYIPKAAAVSDVTAAPTADEFNALLASLRAAGYLAE